MIYVAKHLLSMTRGSDVVARFAGDEFIIILPNTPLNASNEFANRLKSFFINHTLDFEGIPIQVSISVGLSCIEDGADDDVMSLLKKADAMLYRAKKKKNSSADL